MGSSLRNSLSSVDEFTNWPKLISCMYVSLLNRKSLGTTSHLGPSALLLEGDEELDQPSLLSFHPQINKLAL